MRVIHEVGNYISIEQDGIERLRYHYVSEAQTGDAAPKPYFHPIRTPDGIEMTARSPLDHFWHRGLWFTFKYLNGVNYWEENQTIVGKQRERKHSGIDLRTRSNGHYVEWTQKLNWSDTEDGTVRVRLRETRHIGCELLDDGTILLTLTSHLTPLEDVLLDRTPFTTWGGYGGLYIRMTQALQNQRLVLAGEKPGDEVTADSVAHGTPHRWGGIEGRFDAEYDTGERWGAFVFMPSPDNARFPEPFYGDARPFYNFFGPAPLFHEPIVLKTGEPFDYAVQTLILPRRIESAEVERYYSYWEEQCRLQRRADVNMQEELESDE